MGDARLRKISVVTVARSDYGIYVPVLRKIQEHRDLTLHLIVGGMHLSPEFGLTVEQIEHEGFAVDARVESNLSSDTPLGTAKSIGLAVIGYADVFATARPDIILLLGDRFEMHAAALAALPFGIPVAHIHGGEVTEGAIDDALRHGITKIAHLHFASTQSHADRIIRMGEEPWRVTLSGAPSLDNLSSTELLDAPALWSSLDARIDGAPLLVTYHPVTRQGDRTEKQVAALLSALEKRHEPIIFTLPNADSGNHLIRNRVSEFVATHANAYIFDNLGTQRYFSLMRHAVAMVGNSSSGIIEAASFGLPVVNVGLRQAGRTRGENVIDVVDDENAAAIANAIDRAASPATKVALANTKNPYGVGDASKLIVDRLASVALDDKLRVKKFHDA